jgi:hypothetical protein
MQIQWVHRRPLALEPRDQPALVPEILSARLFPECLHPEPPPEIHQRLRAL